MVADSGEAEEEGEAAGMVGGADSGGHFIEGRMQSSSVSVGVEENKGFIKLINLI